MRVQLLKRIVHDFPLLFRKITSPRSNKVSLDLSPTKQGVVGPIPITRECMDVSRIMPDSITITIRPWHIIVGDDQFGGPYFTAEGEIERVVTSSRYDGMDAR